MDLYKIDNTPPTTEYPEGMEAIILFRRELNPPKFVHFAVEFYEHSCGMVAEVCTVPINELTNFISLKYYFNQPDRILLEYIRSILRFSESDIKVCMKACMYE